MKVEHIKIPKFDPEGKRLFDAPNGYWTFTNNDPPTIFIRCSEGHLARLIAHRIEEDGKVTPSIGCSEEPAEHWHVFATLEDWHLGLREPVKD